MNKEFFFQLQTQMHHGFGWSRKLGDFLKEKGLKRVLVLVDDGCATHSAYFTEIMGVLNGAAEYVHIERLRGTEEPDYDYLDEVAALARAQKDIDLLLGIGGGSALDIAKAVAVLMTNPGKGIEYRGFHMVKNPGVPCMCIPTTAGTGSEVTINAVFTDKKEMKKLGINGRYMHATWAVLDAEWTMSCPPSVALSSGMDALVHSMESYMCNQHNMLTRMFSKEAFRLLYLNLPKLVQEPQNTEARQNILLASFIAAAGLFNSGSGISGGLSYPLGVHHKVPHGIGGGIFIASVVEYNVSKGYLGYSDLLDLVEQHPDWNDEQKNKRFAELFRALSDSLGVPRYLTKWGVTKENVEEVAKLMHVLQGAFNQNPVPFSATDDARAMLKKHVE